MEPFVKHALAIALAGLVAGCATSPRQVDSPTPTTTTSTSFEVGAATPRAAIDRFLETIKQQDIQATAMVWGTNKGPARDQMTREYQEKAIIIMQCYLAHDSFRVINDAPGEDGKRIFQVTLTNAQRDRTAPFTVVKGPRDRWYVEYVPLEPLADFCRNPPGN